MTVRKTPLVTSIRHGSSTGFENVSSVRSRKLRPSWGWRSLGHTMSRRILVRTFLGALLLLLAAGGWIFHREIGRTFSDDPTVWELEIAAFERADRE